MRETNSPAATMDSAEEGQEVLQVQSRRPIVDSSLWAAVSRRYGGAAVPRDPC